MSLRVYIVGAMLLAHVAGRAQEQVITLEDAKRIALGNNLTVVQTLNNISAAESRVTAAYGGYLPTLSANGGWNRYQNERPGSAPVVIGGITLPGTSGFSVQDDFRAGLGVNLTLFDGLAREGGVTQATSGAESARQISNRARQTAIFQVEAQYLNILRTRRLVRVAEENLKRDQRQLERITESNRVGALSLADVYRQQSQVATDELALITAQNDYNKAKADLISLVGLDMLKEYEFNDPEINAMIAEAEADTSSGRVVSFAAMCDTAFMKRPDYHSAVEQLRAAEGGVRSARSGYFPVVTAGAGYSLNSNEMSTLTENKTISWGINFQWNLFDAFRTNQSLEIASTEQRNAEVGLTQLERDIRVEVKKALLDLEAARKGYQVSEKGLVSAREDLKIEQERYSLGAGTLLDLLTASANYVNAEANKVNATYNLIMARHQLQYVVGDKSY
jgi:outer membrane protein